MLVEALNEQLVVLPPEELEAPEVLTKNKIFEQAIHIEGYPMSEDEKEGEKAHTAALDDQGSPEIITPTSGSPRTCHSSPDWEDKRIYSEKTSEKGKSHKKETEDPNSEKNLKKLIETKPRMMKVASHYSQMKDKDKDKEKEKAKEKAKEKEKERKKKKTETGSQENMIGRLTRKSSQMFASLSNSSVTPSAEPSSPPLSPASQSSPSPPMSSSPPSVSPSSSQIISSSSSSSSNSITVPGLPTLKQQSKKKSNTISTPSPSSQNAPLINRMVSATSAFLSSSPSSSASSSGAPSPTSSSQSTINHTKSSRLFKRSKSSVRISTVTPSSAVIPSLISSSTPTSQDLKTKKKYNSTK
eukprot:TRINITY_DN2688_c0_g1_i1.p1 TRINITY_DN2688_c0_g1~~TRINITY_DN2688_c0_g1_i1.p1  ORF type:complete len:388 (+),score=122.18 TRINITY_DN2688_c0_g1_i1:97-1164(+)